MIRILEPFHGAVLNDRLGKRTADGLRIRIRGTAPAGISVSVNGCETTRNGLEFEGQVTLSDAETDIVATGSDPTGLHEHRVRVVWDRNSRPRYRFSIDDNSFFLRDIARERYASLFDCFYLGILRDLNRKYGAKFVLNVFHTTPENDFSLPQFPDSYKGEWADNADWLRLAFHAYNEFPDRPYQYASAAKLAHDYDLVSNEILRFAGEDAYSPATVVHWAMVQPSCIPVLVDRGVRVLSGFFSPSFGGGYTNDGTVRQHAPSTGYDINYLLDGTRCDYLCGHDALKDFATGVIYSLVDIVCNNTPVDQVVPLLQAKMDRPETAEIMDLFTHEQYFWPFYKNHRPDHARRCEEAIRFCAENGYEPVFFHEGFLGV
ncbi:MAG: hypothetical protein HN742_32575 [Lentisphaerae bacterium]|jgi:hypothetical protein|nr:hypothetical protein [Lentisphaerota bacterium]MBT4814081.1 hypothetical protein [Lentisphaerota bacterium]MBT5608994.1 hypothetical protein [Lentisphaerota bacterium]MBT7054671.1 hypothetical protein [Lentisphaerota bacterium]MBT7846651.1 hypothetical protein [Lentisphaerota bacterium]